MLKMFALFFNIIDHYNSNMSWRNFKSIQVLNMAMKADIYTYIIQQLIKLLTLKVCCFMLFLFAPHIAASTNCTCLYIIVLIY